MLPSSKQAPRAGLGLLTLALCLPPPMHRSILPPPTPACVQSTGEAVTEQFKELNEGGEFDEL